ncbi:MAG: hypothetical protein ACKO90_18985, partial [Microcystis panniformis]
PKLALVSHSTAMFQSWPSWQRVNGVTDYRIINEVLLDLIEGKGYNVVGDRPEEFVLSSQTRIN